MCSKEEYIQQRKIDIKSFTIENRRKKLDVWIVFFIVITEEDNMMISATDFFDINEK